MSPSGLLLTMLLGVALAGCATRGEPVRPAVQPGASITATVDAFHRAASEADTAQYFSLLAEDAVFIGTDPTERWTRDAFLAFVAPYFEAGAGWTYVPTERHVVMLDGGRTAHFDELLENAKYGTCRGTGVLVHDGTAWRIAQYSLSIPIPNSIALEIVERIAAAGGEVSP